MGQIYHVTDKEFGRYGRILDGFKPEVLADMAGKFDRTFDGVKYERSITELEETDEFQTIQRWFGGESKLQCGLCWGHNITMNAVEYHRSSEINIGAEDMILMLGDLRDVKENQYTSELLELFFIPKGTAVELFGTTLHFAPCQTNDGGFSTVIILPDMTNAPLSRELQEEIPKQQGEERLLFGNNKWMIAHPECSDVKNGFAYPGVLGENRTVIWDGMKE